MPQTCASPMRATYPRLTPWPLPWHNTNAWNTSRCSETHEVYQLSTTIGSRLRQRPRARQDRKASYTPPLRATLSPLRPHRRPSAPRHLGKMGLQNVETGINQSRSQQRHVPASHQQLYLRLRSVHAQTQQLYLRGWLHLRDTVLAY